MRASKTTPPLYLPIMNLVPLRTNPILPPLVLRKYYAKTNFQPNIQPNNWQTSPPTVILSPPHIHSVIPNTAPSSPCHSERNAALLPPVILNAAQRSEESKTLYLSRSTTSDSSPHSKRHAQILPSRTQPSHSAIPNSSPFCHSERSALSLPVILNAAQLPFCHSEHSEESKLIAHTPFTDLSFLPSLETTRANSCHPEHPPIPSFRGPPILPSRTALPSAIPNTAQLPFCHSEHSEESKLIAHTPFTDLRSLALHESGSSEIHHTNS